VLATIFDQMAICLCWQLMQGNKGLANLIGVYNLAIHCRFNEVVLVNKGRQLGNDTASGNQYLAIVCGNPRAKLLLLAILLG
jgi:1,4-dihydroxy-2-naphthoate octaprenyltransferase